jgi:ribosomal protein S18 acetylase RimI-like enzyme
MLYRPFRNSDPPALVEIWCQQPPLRGRLSSVSTAWLDLLVFAKLYFDRQGLILACDGETPVGFVHAGFGPSDDFSRLSTERGVTALLMIVPRDDQRQIAAELLARSEQYLAGRGARELYAGTVLPLCPFYLGLYGGSELPGVLASDAALEFYRAAGYEVCQRRVILQRGLTGWRPLVDRQQVQIRRRYEVAEVIDPPPANWWEACTFGHMVRTRFVLTERDGGPPCGTATFWDLEPLASRWGVQAAGLIELEIASPVRRQGLATFLVGEALRQLQSEGNTLVEVHVASDNVAATVLFTKLGFHEIDQGVVLHKRVRD